MSTLIMTLQLLLGLSLLVFIHEMGHYLAARAFGIRVTRFYLFFDAWGFKLFKFKYKDTEFGIGWLPFGGYCQISGMIDETQSAKDLSAEPQSWEFRSKPAWQRFIVMFGGIFLNFVTGIVIFSLLLFRTAYLSNDEVSKNGGITPSPIAKETGFCNGDKILTVNGKKVVRFQDVQTIRVLLGSEITVLRGSDTVCVSIPKNTHKRVLQEKAAFLGANQFPVIIDSFAENSTAQKIGMQKGDKILRINANTIDSYSCLQEVLALHKNQDVQCLILRDTAKISMQPKLDSLGKLGIYVHIPYQFTQYSLASAFTFGYKDATDLLIANTRGLGKLFTGEEKASESVQGPIGMAQIYGRQWIWPRFWYVTAIISLILAFMNFLPIPALDGGHIMFIIWEILTGRKPNEKFLTIAQSIGMMLLLAIMIFAFGNDLFRVLGR